jgi:microcystin-dependent protein
MSTPFMSQIEIFSFNFAPRGWALCNGQFLPINQNQALFALMGTTYGGNGQTTFALPDLRSRVPIHMGNGHTLGERGGEENHTVNASEMPQHNHTLVTDATHQGTINLPATNTVLAQSIGVNNNGGNFGFAIYGANAPTGALDPNTVTNTGGSQPHNNLMPYLCVSMCIALQGIFPSQN